MPVIPVRRRVCAIAAVLIASPATAGGGHAFHAGGFRGGAGAPHPRPGGWSPAGRFGVPPISGVIHERAGGRPTLTVYGHTGTSIRYGSSAAYGHAGTAVRPRVYAGGRPASADRGFGRRFFAGRGFVGGLGGGLGYGYGYGGYDAPGIYGAPGTYGAAGIYASPGSYGVPGTYGGQGTYGTTATQSLYGNGGGASYRSERPLAARYVEPPLAPSPDAPYDPGDRYAGDGPVRVAAGGLIRVGRPGPRRPCACGPQVLPYGVGTAY